MKKKQIDPEVIKLMLKEIDAGMAIRLFEAEYEVKKDDEQ